VLCLARDPAPATSVPEAARREYAAYRQRVQTLIDRDGEAAVLSWLDLGLPRDQVSDR
jgi:hypothetical protein